MAAQRGRGTGAYTAAVPLADGGTYNYSPKFRQNCKAARIHGMILCRTENFTALPWQGARQAAHCFRMPVTGRIHDRMASGSDEGF